MADVTGPISSLPGALRSPPEGTMCDDHPHILAVRRLQGETDSFGSEQHDLCQICVDRMAAYRESDEGKEEARLARMGTCDWCGQPAIDLRKRRDYDEGSYGRLYEVCGGCVTRENRRLAAELENMHANDDFWDDSGRD